MPDELNDDMEQEGDFFTWEDCNRRDDFDVGGDSFGMFMDVDRYWKSILENTFFRRLRFN